MNLKGLPISQVRTILLKTAQKYVNSVGWSQRAIVSAADEHQFPAAMATRVFQVGDLVEFTMDGWSQQLREQSATLQLPPDQRGRLLALLKKRLEIEAPFAPRWHEAMQFGVSTPTNVVLTSYKLLGHMDQIWRLSGDVKRDVCYRQAGWYMRQAALLDVFVNAELKLLKDSSEGLQETWKTLEQELDAHMPSLTNAIPVFPTQVWNTPCGIYQVASKIFTVQDLR